jgi:hypothetical protein
MGSLRKYIPVVAIVLPVVIAVVIRSTGTGHFRYDAAKWAEPSVTGKNLITPGRLQELRGSVLVINLDKDGRNIPVHPQQISVPADSILSRKVMKKISGNNGPVVIYSEDPAVSARIWMVMSQTGIRNLYILSIDSLNEAVKEKFRTDTIISPEL